MASKEEEEEEGGEGQEEKKEECSVGMELVDGVWMYTDPVTGIHLTHDGIKWNPLSITPPPNGNDELIKRNDGFWIYNEQLVYENNNWTPITDLHRQTMLQNKLSSSKEERRTYTDEKDGTRYEWDEEKKAWFPLVDEDFLAAYQASYGHPDAAANIAALPAPTVTAKKPANDDDDDDEEKTRLAAMTPDQRKEYLKHQKKEKRKLAAEQEKNRGWVEFDETKNTNIYISGLPLDTTDKELEELVQKCGVVQRDPRTNKPKLKLYRDTDGTVKGDARCCYVKFESVQLALQLLDGCDVRGNKLSVEQAQFQQKGDYDPSKKKKKLSAQQKKRWLEQQQHTFDWKPEKLRSLRPKSDCTVVLSATFTLKEFEENAARLIDLEEELRTMCSKYGTVKKIVIYDNNPEGISCVTFDTAEMADDCVTMMNYRQFRGRQLRAALWDGKTKFRVIETEEQKQERLANWKNFIENPEPSEQNAS